MSTIAAGTTTGTALVTSGDTTGQLVLQTNGTTTAVTIGTNQVVTLAQPLPVASGGTGASSLTANNVLLGNGTSAVQFVAPGTNGNVLMSNGTTWTSAAVSSGALTLLQTVTASSSSTVDVETGIGSTYDFYLITFTQVTQSSNGAIFQARMKISGSYQTSSYQSASNNIVSNGSGNSATNQSSATHIRLNANVSSTSGSTISGQLWFSNPTNTTLAKALNFVNASVDTSTNSISTFQGTGCYTGSFGALSGIRFFFDSGTVATGVFRLYGFANS